MLCVCVYDVRDKEVFLVREKAEKLPLLITQKRREKDFTQRTRDDDET